MRTIEPHPPTMTGFTSLVETSVSFIALSEGDVSNNSRSAVLSSGFRDLRVAIAALADGLTVFARPPFTVSQFRGPTPMPAKPLNRSDF